MITFAGEKALVEDGLGNGALMSHPILLHPASKATQTVTIINIFIIDVDIDMNERILCVSHMFSDQVYIRISNPCTIS